MSQAVLQIKMMLHVAVHITSYGAGCGFYHEWCCWLCCISGVMLQAVVHIMSDF
jgi:hypothetical protein